MNIIRVWPLNLSTTLRWSLIRRGPSLHPGRAYQCPAKFIFGKIRLNIFDNIFWFLIIIETDLKLKLCNIASITLKINKKVKKIFLCKTEFLMILLKYVCLEMDIKSNFFFSPKIFIFLSIIKIHKKTFHQWRI